MKRTTDVVVASLLLIILFPLIIIVAIGVLAVLGRPVTFSQWRVGAGESLFQIRKFRTMSDRRNEVGVLLPDEDRLGPFGRFLRSTSLDELPSLWNVVKGDMSLVGPRPLLPEYLPLYTSRQARRHEVRPGITGWAQINGRNAVSWEDRFELDVWYVENQRFLLDLRILVRTIVQVMRREGVSNPGHVTMPRFEGTKGELHE
jgi:sugar transferase EpsL